ncbi:MAG: Hsp20/alpha crystallin family protein [Elusimicrobia bacterium]|nr:Hsp20/alpha crystallin family protein [Elusimicrobiota bacterium]
MAMIPWKKSYGWDPFRDLENLHQDMNKLFNLSFSQWPDENRGTLPASYSWAPSIDVQNRKDKLVVKAELPGMEKDDVKITLEDNYLVIKGEKKQEDEKEDKDKGYYHRECVYGSFQRAVSLPADVDAGKIDASYKNGVLKITLPKKEEAKPKQIDINIK